MPALYYNRFRYYDPESGEYVSQDPIGLQGGMRLYAYVGAVQTNTDPFGFVDLSPTRSTSQRQRMMPYSGLHPNMKTAQDRAAANGKTTLEQTGGGRYLESLKLFEPGSPVSAAEAAQIWDVASERFGQRGVR
jgi:uncharacterized protein RhaS with RHS repeats